MTGGCMRKSIRTEKQGEKETNDNLTCHVHCAVYMQRRQSIQLLIEWGKQQNDMYSIL